jgi:predicted enzyme related to lactoylglutathione lyase
MGWIYLVADPGRAGRALLTLIVHDLEDHLAQLAQRGLIAGEIETLAGVGRKAVITDPEGNMITFAEVLSTTGADSRHE